MMTEIGGVPGMPIQPTANQPANPAPENDRTTQPGTRETDHGLPKDEEAKNPDKVDLDAMQEPPDRTQEVDKDLFLQLLVTQMQYQDPLSEEDEMGDFITQMSLFTVIEQVNNMQDAMEEQTSVSQRSSALNLLNTEVEIEDGEETVEGLVTSVDLSSAEPRVTVNDEDYPLSKVIRAKGGVEGDG